MKNNTRTDTKERSQLLAGEIKEKYSKDIERGESMLMEFLFDLFGGSVGVTWEEPFNLEGLLQSITCLLTNPKISKKLDKYNQEHAGQFLRAMQLFFNRCAENKEIHKLLTYHNLDGLGGMAKDEDLNWIEDHFLKD